MSLALALAALLASPVQAQAPATATPLVAAATLPHISITAIGRGSPVVLIPGLSTPRQVWAQVAPQIARGHRVLLVQINGFGDDDPGENLKPALLDGIVGDLHGYLAAQKLGPAAVIGHSMGGLLALMLARAHPADVSRVMVVDALPYVGEIFVPGATVAMLAPRARALRDQLAAQYGKPDNPAADAAIAAGQALTPAARANIAGWIARADPRVTAAALWEDLSTDLRPDLAAIATPLTVVYPYANAIPRDQVAAFYRNAYARAPHVEFVQVAGSGHFIMLDQPRTFAAAVTRFLR